MKYITLFIFGVIFNAPAYAEPIELLRQRANSTYEQMMEAKHNAEHAAQDSDRTARELQRIKKQLLEAEQKANIAKTKSETAQQNFTQATNKWRHASEALAQQWHQSK